MLANLSDNAVITNVTFQGKVQKLPFSQCVLLPSLVNNTVKRLLILDCLAKYWDTFIIFF